MCPSVTIFSYKYPNQTISESFCRFPIQSSPPHRYAHLFDFNNSLVINTLDRDQLNRSRPQPRAGSAHSQTSWDETGRVKLEIIMHLTIMRICSTVITH